MTATLAPINSRLSRGLRPPRRPRSLTEFAGTLRLPDGPSAGNNWVPTSEPTQRRFLDVVESGRYRKFVVVAPSQRGKTLKAVLCPCLYAIAECRQSVGYVMPNLDKLTQTWEGKLKPAWQGTGYGGWLPTKGPGARGGKPAVITLRDPSTDLVAGRLYFMAMGKGAQETSLSSVSPQTLVCDEGDDAESAGQLELVFKRIQSYGIHGRAYIVSTVNDRRGRDDHPILSLHARGSQHRMHHRCPHCSEYVLPTMDHLNLEAKCLVCGKCGALWSEDDRHVALNNGVWCALGQVPADGRATGPLPDGDIYSELTNGLDYHMAVIADICGDIVAARTAEAKGDYSLMRTVSHKVFCVPYEEPEAATEITNKGLSAVSARSDYDKRIVPHWVTHMSGAVDVQGDRHYWMVLGHGPDDRWCVVDWGYEYLVPKDHERKPTPSDRRRVLSEVDALFDAGWQKEGGDERLSPLPGLRGVDVGFETDEIVGWLRGVRGWRPVRGVGKDTLKHFGEILELPAEARTFVEVRKPDGWPMSLVNVQGDNVRKWIHAGLLRDPYTAASGMLPRGLASNDHLVLHMSGEVHVTDKDGKPWLQEVRKRHDWLDCCIYATALSRLRAGVQSSGAGRSPRKYGNIGNVGVK